MKYGKRLLYNIVFSSFIFISTTPLTAAKVYVNEFASSADPDWIELYNSGPDTVDLATYVIRDSSATNKLELSGTINAQAYLTVDWSNKLNNAGDTIKLLVGEIVEDEIAYGDNGTIGKPEDGQSMGREVDGGGNWTLFSTPSKGSSNATSVAAPTPTPTVLPTATPTASPTPTKVPTPTKSPTSTPIPTATKIPTATPVKTLTSIAFRPTATITEKVVLAASNEAEEDTPTPVLIVTTEEDKNPTTSPSLVKGTSVNPFPSILVVFGLILVSSCGILLFLRYRRKGELEP